MPSIRERRIVWGLLYVVAVAITALYHGGAGLIASAGFLAIGFWAGRLYRNDRDH